MDFEKRRNSIEKPPVLYHASSNRNISEFETRGERTRDSLEAPSVFATPNKALASCFLVPSDDSWVHIGTKDDIPFIVISDKDRFLELDKGGAIYTVPTTSFQTDPLKGMGEQEWTSIDPVSPLSQEEVTSALETMLELGVQIYFVNKDEFDAYEAAPDGGEALMQTFTPEQRTL